MNSSVDGGGLDTTLLCLLGALEDGADTLSSGWTVINEHTQMQKKPGAFFQKENWQLGGQAFNPNTKGR